MHPNEETTNMIDAWQEFMDHVEEVIFDHGTPPQAYKPTRHHKKRKEPTYAIRRTLYMPRKYFPYARRA